MRARPFRARLVTVAAAGVAMTAVGLVAPAAAQPDGSPGPPADRAAVLAAWTQPTAAGAAAWKAAHDHPAAWAAYRFDWSTDDCTDSPERPLGFDFTLACARHDFGHRNYAALGQFLAVKTRIDAAFRFDLDAVCGQAKGLRKAMCGPVAWTYYEAARVFGSIPPGRDPTR